MYNFIVPKQIKKAKNTKLRSTIAYFASIIFAVAFAGVVSFKLYLGTLPPINNLEEFRPNIITKFYSKDGEIIKTFTAYTFKNVDLEQFETEELALQVSDIIECLQAVDDTVKTELGSGFFVEISNFEMETEDSKMILVMISDSNGILRKLFSVEFFSPVPVAAKVVVRKK